MPKELLATEGRAFHVLCCSREVPREKLAVADTDPLKGYDLSHPPCTKFRAMHEYSIITFLCCSLR